MKIKSNAATAELSSPFFKLNENFCREFEHFIASKNGKVKGNFNAWSYFIQGKITNPKPWHIKYKKATYSSTGNLLLSSKSQSLLTTAEWSTPWVGSQHVEFSIKRKHAVGLMERILKKEWKDYQNYLISSGEKNISLIDKLKHALSPLFDSKEIYSIILKNDKLTISLRTDKHHFDSFEKLMAL